jgi:hypothetical protein
VAWGRELGRRFRDEVRSAESEGVGVDAWQFDELVAELGGSQGRAWREFTRGTLHGLTFGRTELGDGPRIGFVWASRSGLRIARLSVDAELRAFWRALAAAAFGLVGEEYPPFSGNPEVVAQAYSAEQRELARRGTIRRELAARYVVGMTPGWHLARGLGGNVNGWPRREVNRWRAKYVEERERIGGRRLRRLPLSVREQLGASDERHNLRSCPRFVTVPPAAYVPQPQFERGGTEHEPKSHAAGARRCLACALPLAGENTGPADAEWA